MDMQLDFIRSQEEFHVGLIQIQNIRLHNNYYISALLTEGLQWLRIGS